MKMKIEGEGNIIYEIEKNIDVDAALIKFNLELEKIGNIGRKCEKKLMSGVILFMD